MKVPTRVVIPGVFTKRGKPKTKTVRIQTGDAPDFERFPHTLPGRELRYLTRTLPFPWESIRRPVSDNTKTPSTESPA
jgi:hypothetical protein